MGLATFPYFLPYSFQKKNNFSLKNLCQTSFKSYASGNSAVKINGIKSSFFQDTYKQSLVGGRKLDREK